MLTNRVSILAAGVVCLAAGCDQSLPPKAKPESIAPVVGSTNGGDHIAIRGKGFTDGSIVLFDGVPATDVHITEGVITAVTPKHDVGSVTVTVHDSVGRAVEVPTPFEYVRVYGADAPPRLVGAISLGNTTVRVTFSEPVAAGAEASENYSIVQANVNPESGALGVVSAVLSDDGMYVTITTASQSEVTYSLTASNIRDLDGNLLAPPELLVNPSEVQFAGTPPAANGTLVDTDGDGLPDDVEQNGWVVTVVLTNGDVIQSTHTSDISLADTDADGLSDAEELLYGTNPRNPDTDGDTLTDAIELNYWYSDPTDQDSDDDGMADATDLAFNTSPILDDTDGDGMSDGDELFSYNRDPLVAQLPQPQIVVADYALYLNVTSSFTDETGTTQSVESAISTGVSQAQSSSIGRSDTRSTEATNTMSQSMGGEVAYSAKDGWGGKVTFNAGFEEESARGYSSSVDTETARESQSSYDKTVAQALETSALRSVSRNIDSAMVQATINVANPGQVPFTITNIEISLLRQDRAVGGGFRPVATLRPAGGQELSLNLGPFDSERGPLIFENTDIFPNVVEDILRQPTGLVFKVANFDVLDANGNNYAFSLATVNRRTAGLTVDYGDGRVETFRIATSSHFGSDGLPAGVSMTRALEIAGLTLTQNDQPLPNPLPTTLSPAILSSVGTLDDSNGVERVVRVRDTQNDLSGAASPEKRFWTVQTNNFNTTPDTDFSSIQLHAGEEYLLVYTRDLDQDGLYEREENMYGSSDSSVDTDGDGLTDFEEVRDGWTVRVLPGQPHKVFSDPARFDSDLDGLSDAEEREHRTDPNRSDTDGDGLSDLEEIQAGFSPISLADGDTNELNNPVLYLTPYTSEAINAQSDGTVALAASGDDVQEIAVGSTATAGDRIISAGPNGFIDTPVPLGGIELYVLEQHIEAGPDGVCDTTAQGTDVQVTPVGVAPAAGQTCVMGGAPSFVLEAAPAFGSDDYVRAPHEGLFTLDPTRADTDFDGIPDGRETIVGINPNTRDAGAVTDSDNDGLTDREETNGWKCCSGGSCIWVTTNPSSPDTDLDGLPDVYEFAIASNPRLRDSDGDGLSDIQEFDAANTHNYYDAAALEAAARRCSNATNCTVASVTPTQTNVNVADSDGDGRTDTQEIQVSWVVTTGGNQTTVFSDPNVADADGDGLNDAEELSHGTNPTVADTDGDGTSDYDEVQPGQVAIGRDPLSPDQRIQLTNVKLTVVNDCEDSLGDDGGEFQGGDIFLDAPSITRTQLGSFGSNCWKVLTGNDCTAPTQPAAFLLKQGESFTITSSNDLVELDALSLQTLNSLNQSYSYQLSGSAEDLRVKEPNPEFTYYTCEIQMTFHIVAD